MRVNKNVEDKTNDLSVFIVTPAMTPIVGGAETF